MSPDKEVRFTASFETSTEPDQVLELAMIHANGDPVNRVDLVGDDVGDFADLVSIIGDVDRAHSMCELRDATSDDGLREALWVAAVITYGRAFGHSPSYRKGAQRRTRRDLLEHMPQDLAAVHEAILFERDKHIAHRVSDHEQIRVYASARVEPPAFLGTDYLFVYSGGQASSVRPSLGDLTAWLSRELHELLDVEWDQLNEAVAASDRWQPQP